MLLLDCGREKGAKKARKLLVMMDCLSWSYGECQRKKYKLFQETHPQVFLVQNICVELFFNKNSSSPLWASVGTCYSNILVFF